MYIRTNTCTYIHTGTEARTHAWHMHACTLPHTHTAPPSAPRNVEALVITNTSISLRWNPPEDLGERDDFFYTLIAIEETANFTTNITTVKGNVTTGVLESKLSSI